MQRRHFMLSAAGATACAAMMGLALPAAAQEPDAPVVGAPQIIDALTSKDIVLDGAGKPPRAGSAPTHDPFINLQVQFTFDSAQLLPQGKRQLDELAMALNNKALVSAGFVLAGHTDRVGDADYNLRLSHARAEAVRDYLAEAHGVAQQRLQTIGYGFSRLLDAAHPTAAINRRVEVRRVAVVSLGPTRPARPAAGSLVSTPK